VRNRKGKALERTWSVLTVILLSFQNGSNKTYGIDATDQNMRGALRIDP
jgi:hypothetical protein